MSRSFCRTQHSFRLAVYNIDPIFDTTNVDAIKDALEIAIVDRQVSCLSTLLRLRSRCRVQPIRGLTPAADQSQCKWTVSLSIYQVFRLVPKQLQ